MAETYRVGLLGHGTVGAAFERLLAERADAIAHITGFQPVVSGILTRSRGDFNDPRCSSAAASPDPLSSEASASAM